MTSRNVIVAVELEREVTVISEGESGPSGPTGEAGPAGSTTITAEAGETLSGHRAIAIDASGLAVYADKDIAALVEVAGISFGATTVGEDVLIQYDGEIEHVGWSWTPGVAVYLGSNGALTQSVPATGFVVVVGLALAATRLLVDIEPPIALAA